MRTVPLRHLSSAPITNGLGLPGSHDNLEWPRYIRTTDIAGPRSLRDDVFASQPPEVAATAMLEPGDILMTAAGASIGKSFTFAGDYPACFAGFLVRLRPHSRAEGRFLAYWMESQHYWSQVESGAVKSTIENFSAGKYRTLRAPQPNINEQQAVADYLDRETARIDTLIAEQQRLIELLSERKRAILDEITSSAVGQSSRLKWLFAPSADANCPNEQVLSVYRDYGVIPKASRDDNFNRTPENVERYLLVRPGDVVVNRMKAWQGSLGVSNYQGIVSGDYEVLRPLTSRLAPQFAHLLLRSPKMIAEYAVRSSGIRPSQWRLYWDEMGNIEIPVPALETQQSIARRIDEQTAKIDTLILETERFIQLAQERRSALITAAVTGRIDVRTATDRLEVA